MSLTSIKIRTATNKITDQFGLNFTENGSLCRKIEAKCQTANSETRQLLPVRLQPKIKMNVKTTNDKEHFSTNGLLPVPDTLT